MSQLFVNQIAPLPPATRFSLASVALKGPIFDISHADFGAAGNGSTDDIAAIQAAHDAANASGGGTVYFPYTSTGIRVGSSINASGSRVTFAGPGRLITTTDVRVFYITGSKIVLDGIELDGQQTAGTTNHLVEIGGGASRVLVKNSRLLNARSNAIRMNNCSHVRILDNDVENPYVHGIFGGDVVGGCDNIIIRGNRVISPGTNNPGGGGDDGKGIAFHSTNVGNSHILIEGNFVFDPLHVPIELWDDDLSVNHFTHYARIIGNHVQMTTHTNGSGAICISVAGGDYTTVAGNVLEGGRSALEMAYANGCVYTGNVCIGQQNIAITVSPSVFGLNSVAQNGVIHGNVIQGCVSHAIEVGGVGCKNFTIKDNLIDGTGTTGTGRGIFINNMGVVNDADVVVEGNVVKACRGSGIFNQTTRGVDIRHNRCAGNNTSGAVGSESDIYLNFGTQADQDTCRLYGNTGVIARAAGGSLDALAQGLLVQGGFKYFQASVTNAATNFAHGLTYTPNKVLFFPRGNAVVWQSAAANGTNVNLQASVAGPTTVDVYVA